MSREIIDGVEIEFRKSEKNSGDANCLTVGGGWKKSSLSSSSASIEALHSVDSHVYLRDTDDPSVVLKVRAESFKAFLAGAKDGEFDLAE